MPEPIKNDYGMTIVYGQNKSGLEFNNQLKKWEEHRVSNVPMVSETFSQNRNFADNSVTKGGSFYDVSAIPEKGYETPKVFVANEFERTPARIGTIGGLTRALSPVEENETIPYDPHFKRKKTFVPTPKWPFLYLHGVK